MHGVQVNIEALQAAHAKEVAELAGKVDAEVAEREVATARLRKEQEAERERVKRALAELKKKLDRWACMQFGFPSSTEYALECFPT